jgi:hypothetical protein
VHVKTSEDVADRKRLEVGLHDSGVQARDVQHGAEGIFQRVHCTRHADDLGMLPRAPKLLLERRCEQAERMHRLPQVMACGSQETGLLGVGRLHQGHLLAQL